MDDLTSLRAIRKPTNGPTDAALANARSALDERTAAPTRGAWFSTLVARLRRPSPLVVTFTTIAAVAIVGIIVASVYASGIRTAVQPAVPVPTVTSTPKPTIGSQQVFGGDCSTLFTGERVSSVLGSTLTLGSPRSVANSGEAALPVIMRGGVYCQYDAATTKDPTVLYFVVLPSTAKVNAPYCYGTNKLPACSFASVASGLWISGVAYGPKGSGTKNLISKIETLEGDFATKAAAQKPVTVVKADGAWPSGLDCATIDKTADLATVLASPKLEASSGNGPGEAPAGQNAASKATGELPCIWQQLIDPVPAGQVSELDVTILPGGAFARDQFASVKGAHEVSLAGTDGAIRTIEDVGVKFSVYTVFSGSNVLVISGQATDAQLLSAAAALVKTLNAS